MIVYADHVACRVEGIFNTNTDPDPTPIAGLIFAGPGPQFDFIVLGGLMDVAVARGGELGVDTVGAVGRIPNFIKPNKFPIPRPRHCSDVRCGVSSGGASRVGFTTWR